MGATNSSGASLTEGNYHFGKSFTPMLVRFEIFHCEGVHGGPRHVAQPPHLGRFFQDSYPKVIDWTWVHEYYKHWSGSVWIRPQTKSILQFGPFMIRNIQPFLLMQCNEALYYVRHYMQLPCKSPKPKDKSQ